MDWAGIVFQPIWIDVILCFTLLEGVCMVVYQRRTGNGLCARQILLALLPGVLLMWALKASEPTSLSSTTMLCLALAGVAHAVDMHRRWAAALVST